MLVTLEGIVTLGQAQVVRERPVSNASDEQAIEDGWNDHGPARPV